MQAGCTRKKHPKIRVGLASRLHEEEALKIRVGRVGLGRRLYEEEAFPT